MSDQPTKVSVRAIAAPNEVAAAIEGYRPGSLRLYDREIGATVHIDGRERVCQFRDHIELQFEADDVRTARVMIHRPRRSYVGRVEMARVTWSSGGGDLRSAKTTAELIAFAVEVAKILDGWAERGELARLRPSTAEMMRDAIAEAPVSEERRAEAAASLERQVGALVDVAIYPAGPANVKPVGKIRGRVATSSTSAVVAIPVASQSELEWLFERAGCEELSTGDLLTDDGTILLLECEWETVELAEVPR